MNDNPAPRARNPWAPGTMVYHETRIALALIQSAQGHFDDLVRNFGRPPAEAHGMMQRALDRVVMELEGEAFARDVARHRCTGEQ